MNTAALAAELRAAKYAEMTDAEAAAALNALTLPGPPRTLTPQEVLDELSDAEIAGIAEAVAQETPAGEHQAAAAWDYYCAYATTLDLSGRAGELLDALVAAGLVSADSAAKVRAAAATLISRATDLKFGTLTGQYVKEARALNG